MADVPSSLLERIVDRVFKFGPLAAALFLVLYGAFWLVKFMAYDVKGDVETAKANTAEIMKQHDQIAPFLQQIPEKLEENNRIGCAQCWNDAKNEAAIKLCNCNPNRPGAVSTL